MKICQQINASISATSNVKAGHMFGIPLRGTHAHSMVNAFKDLEDLSNCTDEEQVFIDEVVVLNSTDISYTPP